jgi:hypothetical protein
LIAFAGCGKSTRPETTAAEPTVPAHYATYADEAGLFSISYPPDWESLAYLNPDVPKALNDVLKSIDEDSPVQKTWTLFWAGVPPEYATTFGVCVDPLPPLIRSHEQMVQAQLDTIRGNIEDFREHSRVRTTVDGREATIVDWSGTYSPEFGEGRWLQVYVLVGRNAWVVACSSRSEQYETWVNDFQSIVRSLRILKSVGG